MPGAVLPSYAASPPATASLCVEDNVQGDEGWILSWFRFTNCATVACSRVAQLKKIQCAVHAFELDLENDSVSYTNS
jgi:hypothetical protein